MRLQNYTVDVLPGDIVVVGTDGLLDNVFDTATAASVTKFRDDGNDCHQAADSLAELAHKNGLREEGDSPFSAGSRQAGRDRQGGKRDDVTVLVAYVLRAGQ